MRYVTRYRIREENMTAAIERFMTGGPEMPDGVTMVHRWHELGTGRGFAVLDSDDPVAVTQYMIQWSDLVDQTIHPVVDDEGMGAALGALQ